ncbi:MAG: transferrin-binding protein-like solute binding protein [Allosphingosinicella sp.]|uniref:transferrin-binding protein-like solute binding protein n=1 Tax=Allosphingosinicella sp. TaxID=2823234 RepID=UPI00394C3F68
MRRSQTFETDSASAELNFNLSSGTTADGRTVPGPLTIAYDAATQSYSVSAPGRAATFAPSDALPRAIEGETRYRKVTGGSGDILTLVTAPYYGVRISNRYVALGYWQRNAVTGDRQHTLFDAFAFGLETPAAAVPKTGMASFGIDVFGVSATPGREPRVFQGAGRFDIDFLAGIFSTNTLLEEWELLSGSGISGGSIYLVGAGRLSSSDTFHGRIAYNGAHGHVGGTMSGRFYGPQAEELGAGFSGSNADGATVTGAMTGQRANNSPVNFTLTNMVTPQSFFVDEATLLVNSFEDASRNHAMANWATTQIRDLTGGTIQYFPGRTTGIGGDFTDADSVPSANPNFIAYNREANDQKGRLELYRRGEGNSELALTYMTFGRWSSSSTSGISTRDQYNFFTYGLETPQNLLSARTGSARYDGVVYGAGANTGTGARYDVSGTSRFDVDFGRQSLSGALALRGESTNGFGNVDFGAYDFSGGLSTTGVRTLTQLSRNGLRSGELITSFFGPDGEEIGGTFIMRVQDGNPGAGTSIVGATAAKRGE